jgi:hypothetical protein
MTISHELIPPSTPPKDDLAVALAEVEARNPELAHTIRATKARLAEGGPALALLPEVQPAPPVVVKPVVKSGRRRQHQPHQVPPDVLGLFAQAIASYIKVFILLYRLATIETCADGPRTVARPSINGLAKLSDTSPATVKRALSWLREHRLIRPLVRGRRFNATTRWISAYELPCSARHVRLWHTWRREKAWRWEATARSFYQHPSASGRPATK